MKTETTNQLLPNESKAQLVAEKALHEAEERFRLFVNATSDIVFRMNADWSELYSLGGRHLLANTRKSHLTWLEEYIPECDRELVQTAIVDASHAKKALELEHRVIRADGTVGWMFSCATPFLDKNNEITEWAGTASDITKRKDHEHRQAFLLKLADAIRPLSSAEEVIVTACRLLVERLDASRAQYTEIEGELGSETAVVRGEFVRAGKPMTRRFPLDTFGKLIIDELRRGETLTIYDSNTDPRLNDTQREKCLQVDSQAAISVPLIKKNRLAISFTIHNLTPRQWTSTEIDLVNEVTERMWTAVERARAEEALASSEEKYRTLFNSIETGYALLELIYDTDNRVTDFIHLEVNATGERLIGLKGVAGKRLSELAPTDKYWLRIFERVAASGKPMRVEQYAERVNRWFNVQSSRIGGEGSRFIMTAFDEITTRKLAELSLAFLAEITQDLASLTNIDATMKMLCEKIGSHFGITNIVFSELDTEQQFLTVVHEWYHADSYSWMGTHRISDYRNEKFLQTCRNGETYVLSDTAHDMHADTDTKTSSNIGLSLSVPLLRNGKWKFCLSLGDDMPRTWRKDELELLRELTTRIWTAIERARTEAALRESEAQLALELLDTQRLQKLSSQLILENNINELYMQIVDAALALMRSESGSLQMFLKEKNSLQLLASRGLHPESAKHWEWVHLDSKSNCSSALRKKKQTLIPDVMADESMSTDGDAYRLSNIRAVQSTPLVSRNGKIVGMISTHWEQAHHPSERELNLFNVLARQAADLIERKQIEQALKEADRRKDEFLATLSHELRNPLCPITASLYLLIHKKESVDYPKVLETMGQQVNHIVRLVDDLLEVSRITTGKIELHKELINLTHVINCAVEISKPLIESNHHQLTISLPPDPIIFNADIVRLTQVFANLLNNAAKFTPQNGTISVNALLQDDGVIISVRDNGIGISQSLLPQVFELFAQGKCKANRNTQGLGVGLAMARSLVELHDGTIEARSEGPNQGSEFIVYLSLWEQNLLNAPAEEIKVLPENGLDLPGCKVLVVDDNIAITSSIARVLKYWNIQVHTVNNGDEALVAIDSFQPHIILLDIGMPYMNGHEVARHIRLNPQYSHIKLIALTGWGQDTDRSQSKASGFDEHLTKPVEINLLIELLKKHQYKIL